MQTGSRTRGTSALGAFALLLGMAYSGLAWSQPIPGFTPAPSGGGDILADGGYSVQACFDNQSAVDTGYQPTIQVVVPAGSTLGGAVGGGSPQAIQTIGTCATPGGCPSQFVNPNTNAPVPLAEGETLSIVRIALGSFAPEQPVACITMSLDLGNSTVAPIDVTRNVGLTPIFAYGADALDNPTTDPAISGTPASVPVTPRLLIVNKTIQAPEGETATGPNYPRVVRVEMGVANGETVTNANVTDTLPGTLQYATGTILFTGCSGGITDTGTPSGTTPGGTVGRQCGSLTGNGTSSQLVLQFQAFVPQNDAGGAPVITAAAPTRTITNTANATATYDPPGAAPPTTVNGTDSANLTARLGTARKTVSLAVDVGNNGPSRTDTLRYRIEYDLSDYFSVGLIGPGALSFTDVLGDGQTFAGCTDPGTTFSSTVEGATTTGAFTGATCTASAKNATTGETTITFNVGAALQPTYGALLHGDLTQNAVVSGPTRVVVEFLATVDLAYSASPFPGPGSPAIGVGDVVGNAITANSSTAGQPASDTSNASTTIGADTFQKSVYAYNGIVPPPPGYLLAAGDTVTFRVRWDLSVSSFDDATIVDYLPAPLLRVAGFNPVGHAATAGTGNPPPAGQWTTGPADTFTTIGAITAQVAPGVTTNATNNAITWDYGTFNLPLGPQVVDLLITVTATEEPFGDGLNFTNVASLLFDNSLGASSSAGGAAQVQTRAPNVTITKSIVASSNATCAATAPPAGFDDARVNCDAADTIDYRLTLENSGRAPAFNVRVDDNAGVPPGGFAGSCTVLSVVDGNNAPVATSGNLFDTTANNGLTIATIPADTNTAVLPGERVLVNYRCTIANNALASLPDRQIDNTARLKYYANVPAQTIDPNFNFASNQSSPGPNVRQARVSLATVTQIDKAITASSVSQTTLPNINSGETLTFVLTLSLAEGVYQNSSFTDTNIAVPAPITCGAAGFACSPNVGVSGTTITVAPTTGTTTGTITYTYTQPKTASGSNTVSFMATNVPAATDTATWTLGNPAPAVTKAFNPAVADANDTVEIRLGWQNNNANNPMFRCVITDQLDVATFSPATIAAVATPAGYTFSATPGGLVTYTATDTTAPCPTVAAGAAAFSVQLLPTAITGGSVNNTANLVGDTLPTPQAGGAAVNASGSAALTLGSPSINTKVIQATTEPNTVTTGANVAVGERITYRVTFTMPDGLTQAVRLVDDMRGGLANFTYIPGSAQLARNTTALTAANDPGGINGAAPNVFVPVTPQCIGASPCGATQIRFDLGNVANDPAIPGTGTDTYTLEIGFQVANVAANAPGATRQNRGQVIYLPSGSASNQTVNGGNVTARVVGPVVSLNKTLLVEQPPTGPVGRYTLSIGNTATGAGAGPAFDWTFTDVLPPEVINIQLVTPLPAGVVASFTGNTLNGTIARLDPGETVQVQYTAQADPSTPTGTTITNAASARATSLPGANGTGSATPGAPGAADGERTGTGGVNDLQAASAVSYTLGHLGISKVRTSAPSHYAIGDTVSYSITVSFPLGSTQNVTVSDILPPGLAFVPGSAAMTTTGGPVSASQPGVPPLVAGQNLTFNFGTVTASAPGNAIITYSAVVQNVATNQRGALLQNAARIAYTDGVTGNPMIVPASNPPVIQVAEPNLEVAKTIEAGATGSDAGDPVDFRIVVENAGDAVAHRVELRDVLPFGLIGITNVAVTTVGDVRIEGTGTAVTTAHARVGPADVIDVANAGLDGSDFILLGVGARIQLDFRATVMNTVVAGQAIANDVRVPYASQPTCASTALCRDDSGGAAVDDDNDATLNNYAESATTSLTIATNVALAKSVVPPRAVIGETVNFSIRMSVIEGATTAVTLNDLLPVGLTYLSHNIAVGNMGMTIGNPSYNTRIGTGQAVGFDFGAILNPTNGNAADDFIQVDIEARVDNIASNQDGTPLRNGEEPGSTLSATFGSGPTTVFFDADPVAAGRQGVPFEVIEPALGLSKTVSPTTQALGGVVTFTINASHLPASNADAFDLRVTDTLPAGLTFVPGSVSPPGAFISGAGQVITLGTGSLTQAAGSGTVTYQATIDPTAVVGAPLTNTARLEWRSLSGATGAANSGRTGTGGLNDYFATDTATVTANAAAYIDATKTVAIAVDADTSGNLTAGDTLEYTVTLTNTNGAASNVVFTDPTPINTTYVAASATTSAGTVTGTNPLVVTIGPMAPSQVVTITFRVTVNPGTPGGTVIRNQGSVDSDQTVPEPTDVDGNDANGDQPTDILVNANLPGTPLLRATKSVAPQADLDGSGTNTQGDRMRYTIVLVNTGNVPLTGLNLTDVIPAGLTYVAGSATATSGAITVTGANVAWGPIATLAVGASVTATFDVTIASVTFPSQTYVNQGTATSAETGAVLTDGNAQVLDGNQPTTFTAVAPGAPAEPLLDVQKRWVLGVDTPPAGTPSPGDTIRYTVTVTNTGSAPAINVRLTDPDPTCTPAPTFCAGYVPGSLTTSQGAIVSTTPITVNLGTISVGASATVSFDVQVLPATANGVVVANQASVTRDGSATPVLSDDNGIPGDGLNPTLTPISTASGGALSNGVKTLVASSEPDATSTGTDVVVGEVLRFQYRFDVGEGTTPMVAIRDVLPAGLVYVPGSARLARTFDGAGITASTNPNAINSAATGAFVALTDGTHVTITPGAGNSTTLQVALGSVINSEVDANPERYTLEYRVVVANRAVVQAGTPFTNSANVTWVNGLLQPQSLPVSQVALTPREPLVTVTKGVAPTQIPVTGATITYTFAVTNAAGATSAPAFNVQVVDALPSIFSTMTVTSLTSSGATGVVNASTGTTLAINVDRLDPGGVVNITVEGNANNSPMVGTVTNNVQAQYTSLPGANGSAADGVATPGAPGAVNGERTGAGGVNDYLANASAAFTVGSPSVNAKIVQSTTEPDANTANPNVAIGERITYRVTFTLPDGTAQNVRLVDDMRGGLANFTYIPGSARLSRSTTALSSAANPGAINAAAPGTFVAVTPQCIGTPPCDATQIRFDLGSVTNDPLTGGATDTYTLEIGFQVANVAANAAGVTRENRGQLIYLPAGSSADQAINGGSVTARVVVPAVSLTKSLLVERPPTGPQGRYTLEIANSAGGPGAGPAFDWTFTDVLPPELINLQVVLPLPAGVTASFTGNTLNGTVARLDPGQAVQVQYIAQVNPATPTGTTLTNAATVQATTLPGPNGTAGATPGAPGAVNGERTGAGGVNDLSAASSVSYTLGTLGFSKVRVSPATLHAIGDEVTYSFTVSFPLGSTQNVIVTDTLPAGLGYVAGSMSVATTGGPVSVSQPGTPTVAGQNVVFNFGTVTASAPGNLIVTYRAVVQNVASNQRGTRLQNNAQLAYFDVVAGAVVTVPASNPPAIQVAEPDLEVVKTVEAGQVGSDAGDPVDFRIVVENLGDTVARRVDLRDVLPAGLHLITNVVLATTGDVRIEGSATSLNASHARVVTTTNTADTLDIAAAGPDGSDFIQMGVGSRIQLDFRARLMSTVTPGQVLANGIRVPYASQGDCPSNPQCRDDSGGIAADDDIDAILNNYADSGLAALTVAANVSLAKTVSAPTVAVGDTVTFTIRLNLIEGTTTGLTLTDVLPGGFGYVSHSIAVGNLGFTIGNPLYNVRLGTDPTVSFAFGDVVNPANFNSADDYLQIDIVARANNVVLNQDGAVLSNGEQAGGSTLTATHGAGTVSFDADPTVAGLQGVPVTIVEPVLTMSKSVLPLTQALGGVVTFRVDVSHLPASTSDAFGLTLIDTLPAGLTFLPGSVNPPGVFVSSAGQVLTMATSSLTRAVGSGTVTYQATVDPAAAIGAPLTNSARLEWRSIAGATGTADSGRTGSGAINDYFVVDTATVTANAAATIDATKTVAIAVDADTSGGLTAGDTLEYTVTLRNGGGAVTNAVFTDPTPANTTYVPGSATTTAGTVTGTNPLVVTIGPMLPGATITITFRVVVNAGTPGGTLIRNQGSVDSDQTVPEPTDVDGNDANGDQPTDILVNAGLPGTPLLRATKTVAPQADLDGSGTNTQGDRMRYTITLSNFGNMLLTDLNLADTIPAGLTFVPGSATATSGTITVTGASVAWGPILLLPVGASVTATFDVIISSVTFPNQTYVNQGTANSAQTGNVLTDGNAQVLDGSQPTIFIATAPGAPAVPALDVQKRWLLGTDTPPTGVASPNDTIRYTITVTNYGAAPATNVRLTDPNPVCSPPPGTCTSFVAGSLTTSQGAVVSTAPIDVNLGTIAMGATATVTFDVLVDGATGDGVVVANQASVTRDGLAPPTLSDDNGVPSDGLNPTLTPISTSTRGSPDAGTKLVVGSSEPDTITAGNDVVVGEVVRFQYGFALSEGTTLQVQIVDNLPAGLVYVPGSARLGRAFDTNLLSLANPGGINGAASGTFVPLVDGTGITVTPGVGDLTTLTVNLGNVTNSDVDLDQERYILEYRAVVANRPGVQAGSPLRNAATVNWLNGLLQPERLPLSLSALTVREPVVTVAKSVSPNQIPITGGTATYTIEVRNAAAATASPAFDMEVIDILPAIFTSMTVSSVTSSGATGVVDVSTGTTVRVNVARLDPGGLVTIVVSALVGNATTIGPVDNTARALFSSLPGATGSAADGVATPGLPGTPTGERNGLLGSVNDYASPGTVALMITSPAPIPTLSEWMLALLALMMAGFAARRGFRPSGPSCSSRRP